MTKRAYQANPVVIEIPTVCPACGSAERRVLRTDRFDGEELIVGGKTYPGQVRRRVCCDGCGQHYMVKSPIAEPQNARI